MELVDEVLQKGFFAFFRIKHEMVPHLVNFFFDFVLNDLLARVDDSRVFAVAKVHRQAPLDVSISLDVLDTFLELVVLFVFFEVVSEIRAQLFVLEPVQFDESAEDLLGGLFALGLLREEVLEEGHHRVELLAQLRVAQRNVVFAEQLDLVVDEALDDVLVHFVLPLGTGHSRKRLDRLELERIVRVEVLVLDDEVGRLESVLPDQPLLQQLLLEQRAHFVVLRPQLETHKDLVQDSPQIHKVVEPLPARARILVRVEDFR